MPKSSVEPFVPAVWGVKIFNAFATGCFELSPLVRLSHHTPRDPYADRIAALEARITALESALNTSR